MIETTCYDDISGAIDDFEHDGMFYAMIEVEIDESQVAMMKEHIKEHVDLNVSNEFVVEMIAKDSAIATEVFNDSLIDTDARSKILGYLANYAVQKDWPCGGTPQEEKGAFYKAWNEKIVELGWKTS